MAHYPIDIHAYPKPGARAHPAVIALDKYWENWLPKQIQGHPAHIAGALKNRYHRTKSAQGESAAMREICDYNTRAAWMLPPNASEDTLRAWAKNRAAETGSAMESSAEEWQQYATGRGIASAFGLKPPEPDKRKTITGCISRLRCEHWWRRQARTVHGRDMETEARALGLVHKKAGACVSADAFTRWAQRQNANAQTLADTLAICTDTGEHFNLGEIAATGLANPKNRRAELMTRIVGIENVAKASQHDALFVTWTVPANMHAVSSKTLKPGEGARVTPREAQNWLCDQWAKTRAALDREGVKYYGLRVAEPHHDGTPHWHLVLFVGTEHRKTLCAALRKYAINGATDSARIRHACKIVEIDPARGSATGYVAKYVAKCIDGHSLDGVKTLDDNGREVWLNCDPNEYAQRVRAWASQWSIRQFQFIGTPPVTVWREFRRLEEIKQNPTAEDLRAASDDGDFARYVMLMGGPAAPRSDHPARVRYMADTGQGRYGEPREKMFIECAGRPYVTRPCTWITEYLPGALEYETQGQNLKSKTQTLGVKSLELIEQNSRRNASTAGSRSNLLWIALTAEGANATGISEGTYLSWDSAKELPPGNLLAPNAVWEIYKAKEQAGPCLPDFQGEEPTPCKFNRSWFAVLRANSAPWTCGNNCTQSRRLGDTNYTFEPP